MGRGEGGASVPEEGTEVRHLMTASRLRVPPHHAQPGERSALYSPAVARRWVGSCGPHLCLYSHAPLATPSAPPPQAAVNLNLWITDSSANTDPSSGGLVVFHTQAPADMAFQIYNRDTPEARAAREALLAKDGHAKTRVAYAANRLVMFQSDLFHRTDDFAFEEGYDQRRINLTYLFGERI